MLDKIIYEIQYHFGGNWLIPYPMHPLGGTTRGIRRVEVLEKSNGVEKQRWHQVNKNGVEFYVDVDVEIK